MQSKKYPTPRGDAATQAKKRYRDKTYDRVELYLPKGTKEIVKKTAKSFEMSLNEYIIDAVKARYKTNTGHDLFQKDKDKDDEQKK